MLLRKIAKMLIFGLSVVMFAELDRLLVGFTDLAERVGYPGVRNVHLFV